MTTREKNVEVVDKTGPPAVKPVPVPAPTPKTTIPAQKKKSVHVPEITRASDDDTGLNSEEEREEDEYDYDGFDDEYDFDDESPAKVSQPAPKTQVSRAQVSRAQVSQPAPKTQVSQPAPKTQVSPPVQKRDQAEQKRLEQEYMAEELSVWQTADSDETWNQLKADLKNPCGHAYPLDYTSVLLIQAQTGLVFEEDKDTMGHAYKVLARGGHI